MKKAAAITILKKIADNKDGNNLNHHDVRVLAHGLLSILGDIDDIPSYLEDEIELVLTMLTKGGVPHHARCLLAKHCIDFMREGGEEKKPLESNGQMTPETF